MKTYLLAAVAIVAVVCAVSLGISFWLRGKKSISQEPKPGSEELPKPGVEELPEPGIAELERERKHLETLFADRINFYLVFAAGILIFVFEK